MCIVCPSACWSRWDNWIARLKEGALSGLNQTAAVAMAESRDMVAHFNAKPSLLPRPERYFGRPACDLTEGQLWAYRAACEALDRRHHG